MPLTRKQLNMFRDGLSLHELCSTTEGLMLWMENQTACRKARNAYLESIEAPTGITTYYVTGKQAFRAAIALAQYLFPEHQGSNLCYQVPNRGNRFKEYDGEPVLIWHNYDAQYILKKDGVLGFQQLFDTRKVPRKQDMRLVHSINIIVNDESFEQFTDTLVNAEVKRYDSKPDAARDEICKRIPFVVNVNTEECVISQNAALLPGRPSYHAQYVPFKKIPLPENFMQR